jgi:hypothetical protein
MDISKLLEAVEEKNLSIKDLQITDIVPNVIDDVVVTIKEQRCEKYLPHNMPGEKFGFWKKGRGGIFYKDIVKSLAGKTAGKYVLLEGDGKKIIARLIEEHEAEIFYLLELIDGKIKDKPYMILRTIAEGEGLTKTERYIDQVVEEEPRIIITTNISSNHEDNDNPRGIPLFED